MIAKGDRDLFHKSHGRAMHAPTALYDSLFDKLEFTDDLMLTHYELCPFGTGIGILGGNFCFCELLLVMLCKVC